MLIVNIEVEIVSNEDKQDFTHQKENIYEGTCSNENEGVPAGDGGGVG